MAAPPAVPSGFRGTQWVDVKTPGDGNTYSVGITCVDDTTPASSPTFSTQAVAPVAGTAFNGNGSARQVVVLQIADKLQSIAPVLGVPRQTYFCGVTQAGVNATRATNVRAVSVWATGNPLTTRVAICGEMYDEGFQAGAPHWTLGLSADSSGYVAVFDGRGVFRWAHQLFGGSSQCSCVVTDVSMRVEQRGSVPVDVVTYCGASRHGNPNSNGSLTGPVLVICSSSCGVPHDGQADNGVQWDGLIGRIENAGAGPSPIFHSILGGGAQDGFFGIAELDENRFAVVGATSNLGVAGSTYNFPITHGTCPAGATTTYSIGVLSVFRRLAPGLLLLESSIGMGSVGGLTTARDLVVQPFYFNVTPTTQSAGGPGYLATVVGSTNDSGFVQSLTIGTSVPSGGGPTGPSPQGEDGFVASFLLSPYDPVNVNDPVPVAVKLHGGPGTDGLVGVAAWSEYTDHFSFVGYTNGLGNTDFTVSTYLVDSTPLTPVAPLELMTSVVLGGPQADGPVAAGPRVPNPFGTPGECLIDAAIPAGSRWNMAGMSGGPTGGGVSVDEIGRVTVLGSTGSGSAPPSVFPTTAAGIVQPAGAFPPGRVRTTPPLIFEAVRTSFDMLPFGAGGPSFIAGRTDGTGALPLSGAAYPTAGAGGSSPECALTSFGLRIGQPPLAGSVRRQIIDLRGSLSAGGVLFNLDLFLTRLPTQSASVSAWQVALPGDNTTSTGNPIATHLPLLIPGGALVYALDQPVVVSELVAGTSAFAFDETQKHSLTLPVIAGVDVAIQLVSFVPAGLLGSTTATGPCQPGVANVFSASPAIWFRF